MHILRTGECMVHDSVSYSAYLWRLDPWLMVIMQLLFCPSDTQCVSKLHWLKQTNDCCRCSRCLLLHPGHPPDPGWHLPYVASLPPSVLVPPEHLHCQHLSCLALTLCPCLIDHGAVYLNHTKIRLFHHQTLLCTVPKLSLIFLTRD